MLFSEKKTFELFATAHNQYIWAVTPDDVPVQPTVKHPPKLHVWGGISYHCKMKLYVFTGNMTAEFCKDILKERLLHDGTGMFGGRRCVFQ